MSKNKDTESPLCNVTINGHSQVIREKDLYNALLEPSCPEGEDRRDFEHRMLVVAALAKKNPRRCRSNAKL